MPKFAWMQNAIHALDNQKRLLILEWLKTPVELFPPQVDGSLLEDGVCGVSIARKLRVSQPATSEHLKILLQAKLISGKRIKQWTFYRRNEKVIAAFKKELAKKL